MKSNITSLDQMYSEGDSSEDEDFTFQVSPKEQEGESSSQTIDSWRNKDQASSVPLGQTEGFRSHPFVKDEEGSPSGSGEGRSTSKDDKKEGPSSKTSKNSSRKEEGTSEAPETSEAPGTNEAPGTSGAPEEIRNSPFSSKEMEKLQDKLNRLAKPRSQARVGENQPPVPDPSSSRWKKLLCFCRGPREGNEITDVDGQDPE